MNLGRTFPAVVIFDAAFCCYLSANLFEWFNILGKKFERQQHSLSLSRRN